MSKRRHKEPKDDLQEVLAQIDDPKCEAEMEAMPPPMKRFIEEMARLIIYFCRLDQTPYKLSKRARRVFPKNIPH